MMEPPELMVSLAVEMARCSPCAKSNRGVVIYNRASAADPVGTIHGTGFNGPPRPFLCDGSANCRSDCGRICMHAEMRAIIGVGPSDFARATGEPDARRADLELVHVAVGGPDLSLQASCGPCCEQCSRMIVDVGIAVVWLYEAGPSECPGCRRFEDTTHKLKDRRKTCPDCGAVLVTEAAWRSYSGAEFHRETLRYLGLHVSRRQDVHPFVRQHRSPRYCAACGQEEATPTHRL